jgi:HPt (histidine-containing phosphotransfer) domain-containing protein
MRKSTWETPPDSRYGSDLRPEICRHGMSTNPLGPDKPSCAITVPPPKPDSGSSSRCAEEPLQKPAVFDRSAALDRIDGDEDLLEAVLEVFASDMPEELEALNRALRNDDAAAVALKAHSMKGACLNVGAQALARLAYEIELAATHGRLRDIDSLMPEFERAFEVLQKTISKFRNSEATQKS